MRCALGGLGERPTGSFADKGTVRCPPSDGCNAKRSVSRCADCCDVLQANVGGPIDRGWLNVNTLHTLMTRALLSRTGHHDHRAVRERLKGAQYVLNRSMPRDMQKDCGMRLGAKR